MSHHSPSSTSSSPGAPIRTTRKRKREDSIQESDSKSLKLVETSDVYLSITGDNHQEHVFSLDDVSIIHQVHQSNQYHDTDTGDHFDPNTFETSQNDQENFLPIYTEDQDFDQLLRDIIDS